MDLVHDLFGGGPRVAGPPRSANGASSFHLFWQFPGRGTHPRLLEVSAVLEVLVPPRVDALYFWALQVDFHDAEGSWGGGHTGLQRNRRYRGATAVNWGGYASAGLGGRVLPGSPSLLPGFPDDPNTLSYAWLSARPYRFRVFASPVVPGGWRAEVVDLVSGQRSIIRDLLPPQGRGASGGHLFRPMVWSEVFADCDAPSVMVRWSGFEALTENGAVLRPDRARVNYQSAGDGGCSNTDVVADDQGILQITTAARTTPQGSSLLVPQADARSRGPAGR